MTTAKRSSGFCRITPGSRDRAGQIRKPGLYLTLLAASVMTASCSTMESVAGAAGQGVAGVLTWPYHSVRSLWAEKPAGEEKKTAAELAREQTAQSDREPDTKFALREFILGSGDEIEINVYGEEELNKKLRIPPDGLIFFPFVGEINVKGTGIRSLRRMLTNELSKYLVEPQVSVEIATVRSQKIYVLGEVNRPGIYQYDGRTDAIEAIASAGGFTLDASQRGVLHLTRGPEGREVEKLNLTKAIKYGDPQNNPTLRESDVIYVPSSIIADVERFSQRLENILLAIIRAEQGIVLQPLVEDVILGEEASGDLPSPVIVTPP